MRNRQIIFLLNYCVLTCFAHLSYGQGSLISGNTTVTPGSTETYTCVNCQMIFEDFGGTQYWSASNGTVLTDQYNHNSVSVKWSNTAGNGAIMWRNSSMVLTEKQITIGIPAPPTPPPTPPMPILEYNCTEAHLVFNGTPPSGVTWYWQTTINSTSQANSSSTLEVTDPGHYYLKPYDGTTWGSGVSKYFPGLDSSLPTAPVATGAERCESGTVTLSSNSATDRWYTSASGGNIVNTGISYTKYLQATTTYYVEAINDFGCVSATRSPVTGTVWPMTIPGSISGVNNRCGTGSETFTLSGHTGTILRWQYRYKNDGGGWTPWSTFEETNNQTSVDVTLNQWNNGSRIYNVRALVKSGTCSTGYPSFTVTVNPLTVGGSISGSTIKCGTGKVSFGISGQRGTILRWQVDYKDGNGSWTGWTTYEENDNVTSINPTLTQWNGGVRTYKIRAVVKRGNCSAKYPSIQTTVDPSSEGGMLSSADEQFGVANGTLTLDEQVGDIVKWQYKTSGGWNDIFNINDTYDYINIGETTDYRVGVQSGSCPLVYSNQVQVKILEIPSINYAINSIRPGQVITLTTDGGHSNYEWFKDGISIQDSSFNQLILSSPGDYHVRVTSNGGAVYATEPIEIFSQVDVDMNAVINYDFLIPVGSNVNIFEYDRTQMNINAKFYDGLGRLIQNIGVGESPSGNDIVKPMNYDEYGRIEKEYLPYVDIDNTKLFKPNALNDNYSISNHYDYYLNQSTLNSEKAFAQKIYETSSLNRLLKQGAPGEAWQPGTGRTIRYKYRFNKNSDVKFWLIDQFSLPQNQGFYDANKLYKTITTDEENHQVIEFKDKLGQTILKRVQADEGATEWADTYYIYDDFGNLRYVLPPEAVKEIGQLQYSVPEPINYWNFDQNAGAILEDIKGNNNGTINGASWVQGISNGALFFDGINDYVEIAGSNVSHSFIQNSGVFTISLYAKISDLNSRSVFVSSTTTTVAKGFRFLYETYGGEYGDHQLGFSSTHGISGEVNLMKGQMNAVDDNSWHHVAVVGDGTNVRFYVDGNEDGEPQPLAYYSSGNSSFNTFIGGTRTGTGNLSLPFKGVIDEVKIFNQALSQQDISGLAQYQNIRNILDRWAFQYKYDGRNRMVEKKVPGADPVYMIYDNRDRLVLTQDGNQRKHKQASDLDNEWTFTKYDALNRPVATGIYTDPNNWGQGAMQTYVSGRFGDEDEWYEELGGALHGYTDQSFPKDVASDDYLTITFYDNYDFGSTMNFSGDYTYQKASTDCQTIPQGTYCYEDTEFSTVKGQVTGSKVRILGSNEWVKTVTYYDKKYRVIQTYTENDYQDVQTRVSNLYNFPGWLLETYKEQEYNGKTMGLHLRYEYDHAGRLLRGYHELIDDKQGQGEVLLAENKYNELGELIEKNLHVENGTPQQSIDYRYNIRGWLERINNSTLDIETGVNEEDASPDLFGMELLYNNPLNGVTPEE